MQLDMFGSSPRPTKAGHVPRTSVLAYRERPRDARVDDVLRLLHQWADAGCPAPTSAELVDVPGVGVPLSALLTVRRGLSDALALHLVEHAGTRRCAISGRLCLTWKVAGR